MNESDTRSLNQIKRETEQTRAALTTTVEELRDTVSEMAADIKNRLRPDVLKAEVSGYIRSRGEQLYHDMTEAARRNPMQAIAVGASVAYPVLRIARAIPLPILMIGAGLFLAGSKTGQDLTQKASDLAQDASEEARRRVNELRDQASQLGDQAAEAVSDVRGQAAEALDRAGDAVSGTARQASDQANELANKASHAADLAANAAQETVSQVTGTVRDAQRRASEAGQEFFDTTRERLSEAGESLSQAGRKTADAIGDSIQRNPLLVAGVGLLIGGLIASVLPRSETEESLLGEASNTVKDRARQAAAASFESTKGAVGEIAANVAQQASTEGLTPDDLAEGAADVGQRLQRVAERAVTTAFDPEQHNENHHQTENTGGGKQNG
jgi:ElaB/YqjD/DUF883 family membrane-anchored ribosome-binding protein